MAPFVAQQGPLNTARTLLLHAAPGPVGSTVAPSAPAAVIIPGLVLADARAAAALAAEHSITHVLIGEETIAAGTKAAAATAASPAHYGSNIAGGATKEEVSVMVVGSLRHVVMMSSSPLSSSPPLSPSSSPPSSPDDLLPWWLHPSNSHVTKMATSPQDVLLTLEDACVFIDEARERGGVVLVHALSNMAVACVVAYLMKKYGDSLGDAMGLVHRATTAASNEDSLSSSFSSLSSSPASTSSMSMSLDWSDSENDCPTMAVHLPSGLLLQILKAYADMGCTFRPAVPSAAAPLRHRYRALGGGGGSCVAMSTAVRRRMMPMPPQIPTQSQAQPLSIGIPIPGAETRRIVLQPVPKSAYASRRVLALASQ